MSPPGDEATGVRRRKARDLAIGPAIRAPIRSGPDRGATGDALAVGNGHGTEGCTGRSARPPRTLHGAPIGRTRQPWFALQAGGVARGRPERRAATPSARRLPVQRIRRVPGPLWDQTGDAPPGGAGPLPVARKMPCEVRACQPPLQRDPLRGGRSHGRRCPAVVLCRCPASSFMPGRRARTIGDRSVRYTTDQGPTVLTIRLNRRRSSPSRSRDCRSVEA